MIIKFNNRYYLLLLYLTCILSAILTPFFYYSSYNHFDLLFSSEPNQSSRIVFTWVASLHMSKLQTNPMSQLKVSSNHYFFNFDQPLFTLVGRFFNKSVELATVTRTTTCLHKAPIYSHGFIAVFILVSIYFWKSNYKVSLCWSRVWQLSESSWKSPQTSKKF